MKRLIRALIAGSIFVGCSTYTEKINIIIHNTNSAQNTNDNITRLETPKEQPALLRQWRPTPMFVVGALAASSFGTLWIIYFWYYYAIYSKKNWSAWYNHKTVEQVYELEFESMKKEFTEALRKRYSPFSVRPYLGHMLFNFEKDIIEEINMLNNYLKFYHFIRQTYLYWLLPGQVGLQKRALQNLQRLDFLQHLANSMSASLINH